MTGLPLCVRVFLCGGVCVLTNDNLSITHVKYIHAFAHYGYCSDYYIRAFV